MTDRALIANDLAVLRNMLAIVAAKTALCIVVSNVVRMCPPVGLHFREKVCLIDLLHLGDRGLDRRGARLRNFRIYRSIVFAQAFGNGRDGLFVSVVRAGQGLDRLGFDKR